jgi:CDP-glycerol glycerophosphotransferase
MLAPSLIARLPLSATVDHKPFRLGVTEDDGAALLVGRDLDDDERGQYHQRRLLERSYQARRAEPLRDAVVFTSFRGRQYSDSPRAIHEELAARGGALEHFWVVRDQACRVPATATPCATARASTTSSWPVRDTSSPTTTSPSGSLAATTRSACRPGTGRR